MLKLDKTAMEVMASGLMRELNIQFEQQFKSAFNSNMRKYIDMIFTNQELMNKMKMIAEDRFHNYPQTQTQMAKQFLQQPLVGYGNLLIEEIVNKHLETEEFKQHLQKAIERVFDEVLQKVMVRYLERHLGKTFFNNAELSGIVANDPELFKRMDEFVTKIRDEFAKVVNPQTP